MTIIVDLQTIIDEAERGFFSIDDLKDIVKREKGRMKTLGELIKSAKELITYDEEDEMWVYDEERCSNPPLDAMDLIVHIATLVEVGAKEGKQMTEWGCPGCGADDYDPTDYHPQGCAWCGFRPKVQQQQPDED